MFEPPQTDLDRDVDTSMRMFKKAQVGPAAEIKAVQPQRCLVVLDGSGQDVSVMAAATELQSRLSMEWLILDAREPGTAEKPDADRAPGWEQPLKKTRALERGDRPAYDEILAAIEKEQPDLVIVPCPFGRDFESIGSDSAGTVMDVLISRCRVPMLVIRRQDQPLAEATQEVTIVVGAECKSETRAVGWAICLAAPKAQLTLSLVIDREQYENMRALLDVIAPDKPLELSQLNDAMAESHAHLHAAITKSAASHDLKYRLQPMAYEDAPPSVLDSARPLLVILPLESDDRYVQGFVQDRIRRSPHPVLVVPEP